jgi:DNA-binding Lrp family transcriptional regulator
VQDVTDEGPPISQEMSIDDGWVKLWRKALDSDVFAVPELWHLFTWCLLTANYTTRHVPIKVGRGRSVRAVRPGQFIYGRKSRAKELGLPESTLSDRMKRLEAMGVITIQANSHYSIVTIATATRQATDTDKNGEKGKKGEKVKNGEKARADDDDEFSSWKEARALANKLVDAGTFILRNGGEPKKAKESQRLDLLRACKLATDNEIPVAWLEEAATRTRDNKPENDAHNYFLKVLREICANNRVDFGKAAAGVEVPAELRPPKDQQSARQAGDGETDKPAHQDCAPCVPEGQDDRQDVSAPDRRQERLGSVGGAEDRQEG